MMKKSVTYEIIAAIVATLGAVLLAYIYFPFLNPLQFQLDNQGNSASAVRYFFGTPVALFILLSAWHFNCKAQGLKRDANAVTNQQKPAPCDNVMKVLFVMSLVSAFLGLLVAGVLSAITVIPRIGAQGLRTKVMLFGIGSAIGWGWLAVWARNRVHGVSQTFILRSVGQALVFMSIIYCLGIILFVLG